MSLKIKRTPAAQNIKNRMVFTDDRIGSLFAPWWERLGARLFGEKIMIYSLNNYILTMYRWHGKDYITSCDLDKTQ